jgi:protein-S-isoprenylcysteine O-methyltransferase Ste14
MTLTFVFTYGVWVLSEILYNRLLHSKDADKQNADSGSMSVIWITIIICTTLAVFISIKYAFPIFLNPIGLYAGIALIFVGIILRFAIIRSLGKFFTVDVTIRENHKLKTDGFYKYLRHPSYFASLLSFIGFGLTLNNWISLALIASAILTVFVIRIKVEEKVLIEQFGSEYTEYKNATSGLIPFIY